VADKPPVISGLHQSLDIGVATPCPVLLRFTNVIVDAAYIAMFLLHHFLL
jgi:hypothetical protein